MKVHFFILTSILGFSIWAGATATKAKAEVPAKNSSATPQISSEDVRCEKMMGVTLYDFKATLVENCDLNYPFSTSLSRILNDEVYFYCCRKK